MNLTKWLSKCGGSHHKGKEKRQLYGDKWCSRIRDKEQLKKKKKVKNKIKD